MYVSTCSGLIQSIPFIGSRGAIRQVHNREGLGKSGNSPFVKVKMAGNLGRLEVGHLSLTELSRKLKEVGLPNTLTDVLEGKGRMRCRFYVASFSFVLIYDDIPVLTVFPPLSLNNSKGDQRLYVTDVLSRRH